MATVANVVAKFEADTRDLQAGAKRVTSSLQSIDNGVKKSALGMGALKAGFAAAAAAAGAFAIKIGVDAVKAAAAEEQAIARLATALDNAGQAMALDATEAFIDSLARASGVADDQLRPAMATLVNATQDASRAQELLALALDVSVGTGRDLTSVTTALAKAANGQTTALMRLGVPLSENARKSKNMVAITAELSGLFQGQSARAADTFQGRLNRMGVALGELQEALGKGFLDGLEASAQGTNNLADAIKDLEPLVAGLGNAVGLAVNGLGDFVFLVGKAADGLGLVEMDAGNAEGGINRFIDTAMKILVLPTAITELRSVLESLGIVTSETTATSIDFASGMHAQHMAARSAIFTIDQYGRTIVQTGEDAEFAAEELAAMRAEMDLFLASVGAISAVDKAAESIDNIGAATIEFGTNLMGQTPRARDFRAEVMSAFEDSARAAASLSDHLPTQRAIFTGELIKIVAALRASGVKDSDIEAFLGAMNGLPASVADIMRGAAKAIGDTDFKTEVEKAFKRSVKAGAPMTADAMQRLADGASKAAKEQLGLTLEPQLAGIIKSGTTALRPTAFLNGQLTGKSIGSGLANGVLAESPTVQAAIRRVIQQAHAAAKDEAQSTSPSRLFARTGDDMSAGVAMGFTRSAPRIYGAVRAAVPRAKQEGNALAKALTQGFIDALASGGGSIASAITSVFGSIPTKSPLEKFLGAEDAEKFIKNNTKALQALAQLGAAFDVIAEKVVNASAALGSLAEMTRQPFGRPSEIMNMFGSDANIDSVIRGYEDLAQTITESFSVLTDASIVGERAAKANRKNLQNILGQLEGLTRQAIALREEYEQNLADLRTLEENYAKDVKAINARYDQLDKDAAASIKSIEDRWNQVIPGLEAAVANATAVYDRENAALQSLISERDGFLKQIADGARSFLNNLSFTKRAADSAAADAMPGNRIVETIQDLGNGIRVVTRSEITPAAQGIADAIEEPLRASDIRSQLQSRLDDLRAFSRNIQTLVAQGLDPALVREFVSAGVSGAGEAVAALAAGSADEISAINSIQNALSSEVATFGQYAADEWHNAAIAQQEAVVGAALTQKELADRALAQANTIRATELAKAQEFADSLRKLRQTDLEAREAQYEAEKKVLENRNTELLRQMDVIAQQIQGMISGLVTLLPAQTERAAQNAAQSLLTGFKKKFPEVFDKLNKLMDQLAASMNRTVTITVRTVYEAAAAPAARAMGGPVQARTAYIVGERGPEVFVPYGNGNIIPNHALGATPSMGARPVGGGATVVNINVNAGMGADGAEIGRQIVDSLRQYERRNGPVPIKVTG